MLSMLVEYSAVHTFSDLNTSDKDNSYFGDNENLGNCEKAFDSVEHNNAPLVEVGVN